MGQEGCRAGRIEGSESGKDVLFRMRRSQVRVGVSKGQLGVSPGCRLVSRGHKGAQSAAEAVCPAPAAPRAPC